MTAIRRIHDEQPQPTPPAAALARPATYPCTTCDTTRGAWNQQHGGYVRKRGLCKRCYDRAYYNGTLPEVWERPQDAMWAETVRLAGTAINHPNINPRPWNLTAIAEDAETVQITRFIPHAPTNVEGLERIRAIDREDGVTGGIYRADRRAA